MSKGNSWLEKIIPLGRPEYAKQPEALLTDLIWRSNGSGLSKEIKLARESSLVRLVPKRINARGKSELVETMPLAEKVDINSLVFSPAGIPNPVKALINSLLAPKSRGDKSLACVPIHLDIVALQTLHGLVNKEGPPDLAGIIETIGWLGGADGEGQVAYSLLRVMKQSTKANEGFTGLLDNLLPEISKQAWLQLTTQYSGHSFPTSWPEISPREVDTSKGPSVLAQNHPITPFRWFWTKWNNLCDPNNGWYRVLPTRRFTDWATCLLRTALAFAYIWEANFFVMLQDCISEELRNRTGQDQAKRIALDMFGAMLQNGATLAAIESPRVPASQKSAWNALSNIIGKGYLIRKELESFLEDETQVVDNVANYLENWINSLPTEDIEKLAIPPIVDSNTAPNLRDFVRNLLRPRSSNDDTQDHADFYYLSRTNSQSFWFQPGPEWFVVITSLLSGHPGGRCTLGMLLDDLRLLGLHVERWILVEMLEEAGLSADSPDADNALVISAGF